MWSPFWYSFLRQSFLRQPTLLIALFGLGEEDAAGFEDPLVSLRLVAILLKMTGFLTERCKSSGYELWNCQVGVTIIGEGTFFSSTFFSTQWIKANGLLWYHFCWKASVSRLLISGFQDKKLGSWFDNFEENKSISGFFRNIWHILLKIRGNSFHSEESFWCPDSQSALIVFPCSSRNSQISF